MPAMPIFNLANLFEQAVDAWPDREYIVAEGQRRTFAEMDARANRLAHHLAASGIGPGDHVGIYAYNCVEWVEALWACFKIRAVWININYRYVEDELRYLFDNADLKGLVYGREFAPRVRNVLDVMPMLKHTVVIEDGSEADLSGLGSVPYEEALAGQSEERDFDHCSSSVRPFDDGSWCVAHSCSGTSAGDPYHTSWCIQEGVGITAVSWFFSGGIHSEGSVHLVID